MNSDFESNDNKTPLTLQEYAERRRRDFHKPLVDKGELLMARPRLVSYDTLESWVAEAEMVIAVACSASEMPNKHIHQNVREDDVE